MNNFDAAGSASNSNTVADLTEGSLATIFDGDNIRRGWVSVEQSDTVTWVALLPFDSVEGVWTGRIVAGSVDIEDATAPDWWSDQTTELMQALLRAGKAQATLVEDAHQWADNNNLCGEFDHFMRDHDLPPRRREFKAPASVTLTVELPVPVTARYGEDASTLIDHDLIEQTIRQRFGGLRRYGITVGDYTVGDLQESTG